jgi:cell division inhibitor SepF
MLAMNVFQRMWDSLGFRDRFDESEYEYEYEYEEDASSDLYPPGVPYPSGIPASPPVNNVVGLPSRSSLQEILLLEPRSFEEMPQAVAALRERKSVVLNLALMNPDMAQRCVDFVAGGVYAIGGNQERLGEHIFLFTPNFVQINSCPSPVGQQQVIQPPVPSPPNPAAAWAEKTRLNHP